MRRRHAEHPKVAVANRLVLGERRGRAGDEVDAQCSRLRHREIDQRGVRARGGPHRAIHRWTRVVPLRGRSPEAQDREPVRLRQRQRAQQHRIRQTEHSTRRTHGDGERQDHRRAEARRLPQAAPRVAEVAAEHVKDRQSVHVSYSFSVRAWVAEAQPCLAACRLRRHAVVDIVLSGQLEVRAHLVSALAVETPASNVAPQTHDAGSITRVTAAESCAQRVDSRASSRRPLTVRV